MKQKQFPWLFFNVSTCLLSFVSLAQSQPIEVDGTTSTRITPIAQDTCMNSCNIVGGERRGNNLFHSFSQFDVQAGSTVLFVDPGVINILSRVTGDASSNIEGQLGVSGGGANLFLINPNGILFGQNSSLDVGGAFVATTANAIQFGDQGFFEALIANASSAPALLTINPSALIYQGTNGRIENNSVGGLSVPGNQSLILAGGDIDLAGGSLNAFGGRVELGGVSALGAVSLSSGDNGLSLEFPDDLARASVSITNGGNVDVRGNEGGNIAVTAKDIVISGNNSQILAGVDGASGATSGDIVLDANGRIEIINGAFVDNSILPGASGISGDIRLTAENLFLDGGAFVSADAFGDGGKTGNVIINVRDLVRLESPFTEISSSVRDSARGESGNISIKTQEIQLDNEASISTSTFGQGDAGRISLTADSLSLTSDSFVSSNVEAGAIGNGGAIHVAINSLSLTSGSQFVASVMSELMLDNGTIFPPGEGMGGSFIINARDRITVSGFSDITGRSSGLFVSTDAGAIGQAGSITVNTETLRIEDSAAINAFTLNQSAGGNIVLNVSNFEAISGGQVITSAEDAGDAGDITLNATGQITISGNDPNFEQRRADFPETFLNEEPGASGLFASTRSGSTGNAGNIFIDPPIIEIRDGAGIAVSSQGTGVGGNLEIEAENLTLDDQAFISAETASNQGGNIELNVANLLLLNNMSEISATAGNRDGNGDGGNITIDTTLLLTLDNSDITANAVLDSGGNIDITAQGIFQTPDSDITAGSDFGVDGEVILNTPETDPSDSAAELSENIDIPPKLAQSCRPGQALGNGQFANVGKGGLPSTPSSLRSYPAIWHDIRPPSASPQASTSLNSQHIAPKTKTPPLIEAKGWVTTDQGLMLVAPNRPSSPSLIASGAC